MASSSSPSPSSTSSLPLREHRGQPGGRGGMVEMELDAARVLADLAVSAGTGSESGGSGSRFRKRSESQSPSRNPERSSHGREDTCSSSGYIVAESRGEKRTNINLSSERVESSAKVSSSHSSSSSRGSRVRQNLTQAEKEGRRLRRILANRESARQTIRRRQALREELTRKVADLSVENEDMKMEKDLALKEYLSLKDSNEQLKEQIARTMRPKAEIKVDTSNADMDSPTSSTNMPQIIICGKSPFLPIVYPSWTSSTSQETSTFFEQGIPINVSGSLPTHYMPPCAWYYPVHYEASGSAHYSCAIGSRNVEHIGTKLSLMQPHEELEIAERASVRSSDEKENTVGTEKEISATTESTANYKDDQFLRPSFETSIRMESLSTAGSSHDERSAVLHHDQGLLEKLQGACTWPPDKPSGMMAASTAAEARKRRKELTKLKQSHGRQKGMHS